MGTVTSWKPTVKDVPNRTVRGMVRKASEVMVQAGEVAIRVSKAAALQGLRLATRRGKTQRVQVYFDGDMLIIG